LRRLGLLAFLIVLASLPAAAQDPPPSPDRSAAVRVFLDCPSCDSTYMRTEITFVSYVRDRAAADVHVLVTTQGTGGGGTEYALKFIGQGHFKGVDQSLTYTAPQTATPDERRRGIAGILKLGLVRYVAETPLASRLSLRYDPAGARPAAVAAEDPWNFWVFRVGASGGFDGEQATSHRSVSASLSANRTTEEWKINLNGSGNYRHERFLLEDDGPSTR
jgi:hypothetical protein